MTDTPIRSRTRPVVHTEQPATRTRQRPDAIVAPKPPERWPNGSAVHDTGSVHLGWTVQQRDGSYQVFRSQPIYVGTAKDWDGIMKLLGRR